MIPVKRKPVPIYFGRRMVREIPRALALGTIPVMLNAQSSEKFNEIFALLLAAPFFLHYYLSLLLAFVIVGLSQFLMRFQSERYQGWLNTLHSFFADIGGSFLTAMRTGLGAIIGFLIIWRVLEPQSITVKAAISTLFFVLLLTVICAAFALLEETLRNPREAARRDKYKDL